MKRIFLFLIVFAFAFASCKKDKKDDSCSLSAANLAGSYKITSVKYKASASVPEQDGSDFLFDEDCQKDDIITFNANGTVNFTDVGMVCSPSGDDNSTWSLNGNTITIEDESTPLENFSCSGFNITSSDDIIPGDKLTVTFTRQ